MQTTEHRFRQQQQQDQTRQNDECPVEKEETIEEIRKKQKQLKSECVRSGLFLLFLALVIVFGNIYYSYEKYTAPVAQPEPTLWTAYSDSLYFGQLLERQGFNITSQSHNSAHIVWLNDQNKLVNGSSKNQVINTYGHTLSSKHKLLSLLSKLDHTDAYPMISSRQFIPRHFYFPFTNETNSTDYIEFASRREYSAEHTFLCGIEETTTGQRYKSKNIPGTRAVLEYFAEMKKVQIANSSSDFLYFIEKIVEKPLMYEGNQLQIAFPIQLIGKSVFYNASHIFGRTQVVSQQTQQDLNNNNDSFHTNGGSKNRNCKSQENSQNLESSSSSDCTDSTDGNNNNANFSSPPNPNSSNSPSNGRALDFSILTKLLSPEQIHSMKVIISYSIESFFNEQYPNSNGRNRYSLVLFWFVIDSSDKRVYLSRIQQNPLFNPSISQFLQTSYAHLFDILPNGIKNTVQFHPHKTLRVYRNEVFSFRFISTNTTLGIKSKKPKENLLTSPLDFNYRIKKVAVQNFPNFLNFFEYFKDKPQYISVLLDRPEYELTQCDICFSKFIPKFQPFKNAVWGSISGWELKTKYTFQQAINSLAQSQRFQTFNIYKHIPQTYFFNMYSESFDTNSEKEFVQLISDNSTALNGVWIYKPSSSFGGQGIKMVYDISKSFKDIKLSKKAQSNTTNTQADQDGIALIQKYIENPFLINNKKFDFRMFPIMVSANPLVAIYLPGYVRATLSDFDLNNPDMMIHLTNLHAQKKLPDFEKFKDAAHITVERFEQEFYLKQFSTEQLDAMHNHIKAICAFSMEAMFQDKTKRLPGQFHAFGVDIMIDSESRVKLIEMNSNPYFINGTELHKYLVPKIVGAFLDISLEVQRQQEQFEKATLNTDFIEKMCPYCEILIDETKNFNYIDYFDQASGVFNYDNPVYKNKRRDRFI